MSATRRRLITLLALLLGPVGLAAGFAPVHVAWRIALVIAGLFLVGLIGVVAAWPTILAEQPEPHDDDPDAPPPLASVDEEAVLSNLDLSGIPHPADNPRYRQRPGQRATEPEPNEEPW